MVTEALADGELRMRKAVEALKREFTLIRTGRGSPALVENVMVDFIKFQTSIMNITFTITPSCEIW